MNEMLPVEKLEKLLVRLRAPDQAVRVHAAVRLTAADVDAGAVRPGLEQALDDPDAHVRRLAGWVLARLAGADRQAA